MISGNWFPSDSPKGPGGVIPSATPCQKTRLSKRAVSSFDGQNLFQHAKNVFGRYHPNHDLGRVDTQKIPHIAYTQNRPDPLVLQALRLGVPGN